MTLRVDRAEEEEANWADLLDGLRYAAFRRSISTDGATAHRPVAGGREGEAPGGAIRNATAPAQS